MHRRCCSSIPRLPGPKCVRNIIFSELCERFSFYGLRAVLVLFLTQKLGLKDHVAISYFAYFASAAYAFPVVGGYIADTYLGKYNTIMISCCIYLVGTSIIALSSVTLSIRLTTFGLLCVAMGTGGIKPCVAAFGADQINFLSGKTSPVEIEMGSIEGEENGLLRSSHNNNTLEVTTTDQHDSNIDHVECSRDVDLNLEQQRTLYFNAFYLAINIGSFISFIVMPELRVNLGFGYAFGMSAVVIVLATVLFWSGKTSYDLKNDVAHGSIFGKLAWRILVKLVRKCGFQPHIRVSSSAPQSDDSDLKSLARVTLVMTIYPVFWLLLDLQSAAWMLQATKLNLHDLPWLHPETTFLLNPLLIIVLVPVFSSVLYPLWGKYQNWSLTDHIWRRPDYSPATQSDYCEPTESTVGSSDQEQGTQTCESLVLPHSFDRIRVGLVFTIVGVLCAGFLQTYMDQSPPNSVSVFWQAPQLILVTIGEVLTSPTGLEYSYTCAPTKLRSTVAAMYLLSNAVGDSMSGTFFRIVGDSLSAPSIYYVLVVVGIANMMWAEIVYKLVGRATLQTAK